MIPEAGYRDHGGSVPDELATRRLRREAFLLEYLTVGWNVVEGIAAVLAGLAAGSVALVAFGLESMVKVFASLVVVWELHGTNRQRERSALRLVGVAYIVVALYVLWKSVHSLIGGNHPSGSPPGIALMSVTVIMMVSLAAGKQLIGSKLKSPTVLADAKFSLIDGLLATTVLAGLVLNITAGWWWADPAFAIVLALAAGWEAIESFRERTQDSKIEDTAP